MNVAVGLADTAILTRRSSRPNSSASGKSTRRESTFVTIDKPRNNTLNRSEVIETGRNQSSSSRPEPEKSENRSTSLPASSVVSSCALCHSSSIGYNLCCQFRDVMQLLERERLVENTARIETNATSQSHNDVSSSQVTRRTARSRVGRTARSDDIKTTRTIENTARHGPESSDSRTTTPYASNTSTSPLNERVLQLFAKEDAAMVDLIKFKEKEAYRALYEQAQDDATLSPLAAHFRDRFKHVGLFMQMHRQQQQVQQDGIGGHFQKLHADLFPNGSRTIPDESDYYSDYDSDDDVDSETSNDGQQEVNVQSIEVRRESDEDLETEPERLFPTPQELEKLTPVDTKAALTLYVQNRHAMTEMLDGYAELVTSQMIPTLKASLSTRSRGALMETLDFVARASEFVCARRVQVFVARLLHAVAESDVGDFASFEKELESHDERTRINEETLSFERDSSPSEMLKQVLPLPLHPRRAQQLFQDVLVKDSELTPQLSDKSLPQRLFELQRLNLIGIQEAKRGTRFQRIRASSPHNEFEEVTLVLTKDGSTIQVKTETCAEIVSILLVKIKRIKLFVTPLNSFSLQLDDLVDGDGNAVEAGDIFVASNADTLNRWMVALTCGVNAFQQHQAAQVNYPDAKQADLVWQAEF
ncbi:hypothetical protein F441_00064 [Phytophthora nicotianae CJ01A1]|uniref:PH domain-containing protein n=1 Tax=Phytophthora nicotianae CJ01A1 TaxID=1317063 RepID=W2XY43_PHYNI|nr:hypothetical protein F441_00064 [Phytophthora nicotianae CJ01A1]